MLPSTHVLECDITNHMQCCFDLLLAQSVKQHCKYNQQRCGILAVCSALTCDGHDWIVLLASNEGLMEEHRDEASPA